MHAQTREDGSGGAEVANDTPAPDRPYKANTASDTKGQNQ